jgi:hypothetical protein
MERTLIALVHVGADTVNHVTMTELGDSDGWPQQVRIVSESELRSPAPEGTPGLIGNTITEVRRTTYDFRDLRDALRTLCSLTSGRSFTPTTRTDHASARRA